MANVIKGSIAYIIIGILTYIYVWKGGRDFVDPSKNSLQDNILEAIFIILVVVHNEADFLQEISHFFNCFIDNNLIINNGLYYIFN